MKSRDLRILVRTAGGKTKKQELGLGHVYRTINLVSNFKKKNLFFLIEDFGGVKKLLSEREFKNIHKIQIKASSRLDFLIFTISGRSFFIFCIPITIIVTWNNPISHKNILRDSFSWIYTPFTWWQFFDS